MALSTEDAAWLAELKIARRKLILGDKRVKVASGGRSTEYTPADLAKIEAEIAALEAAEESSDGKVRRRGALTFSWRN